MQVEETVVFEASPPKVWALMTDLDAMTDFSGYGPIPGIKRAEWLTGNGTNVGSVRRIENTDGSSHREEVMAVEPRRLLVDRIHALDSPLRFLVSEATDRFELAEEGDGTRLVRRFRFELRTALAWPITLVFRPLFRRALRRQHDAMEKRLMGSSIET